MGVVDVETYSTALRILATIVCLLGCSTNILVIILSKLTPKNDTRAFTLMIQFTCFGNVVNCFSGWMVLTVVEFLDTCVVFVVFGPAAYLGPYASHLIDCIVMMSNTFLPPMVGLMMLFRAWILFNHKLTRRSILVASICSLIYSTPQFYFGISGHLDISSVISKVDKNVNASIQAHTAYAGTMSQLGALYWNLSNILPAGVFCFCLAMRVVMSWKLKKLYEHISPSSRKVHSAFMNVLTLDSTVVFFYCLGSNIGFFDQLSSISKFAAIIIKTFPYPFFSGPTIFQALALLYFVPYLRISTVRLFRKQSSNSTRVSVVITAAIE